METISFQDFLLKLSLHTSIMKHSSNNPNQKGIQKIHKKMEQNLPVAAKKFWHTVRVVYFMLRKNVSKPKLFADLNLIMKRGKLAGKSAIHNLMAHHGHQQDTPELIDAPSHPTFRLPFHLNKRKRSPSPPPSDADLLAAAMEIVGGGGETAEADSPVLPGFGRTPVARQLRITDSPFPLRPESGADDQVDEAAEKFIMKFYRDLKRQNTMA